MKKLFCVFLACTICLGMCACGTANNSTADSSNSTADSSIELTTENYWRYLSTDISKVEMGDSFYYDDLSRTLYEEIEIVANLEGDSTQYSYQDVLVTIEIYGEYFGVHGGIEYYRYVPESELEFDLVQEPMTLYGTLVIRLNENGIGKGSYTLTPQTDYYLDAEMVSFVTEVVSISGTVTPI